MRASLIQLAIGDGPAAERLETVRRSVAEEAAGGSEVIVLPELWTCGYFAFDSYSSSAEPLDGGIAQALSALAREHRVTILGGSVVESSDEGLHNTMLVFDAAGNRVASYRKNYLFPYRSREPELLVPGRDPVTIDAAGARIGLSICFDLRFPEHFRTMVSAGAEMFVLVAAWPFPRLDAWKTLITARAIENQAIVLACNAAGEQAGTRYLGHSMAVDPWGTSLGELDEKPGTLRVDIDLAAVRNARTEFPALASRK